MICSVIDPLRLAQDLIRCASVTPADAGAQDVISAALRPLGFTVHDITFNNIRNSYARLGTGGPHLCFCGHTDVVPPGDTALWTDPPFAATVRDGLLYGRGAADMKSNIACFIAALSSYIAAYGPPRGSVSLLITGDEEAEAIDGTVRVLQWMAARGETPDVALVGEPTNPDYLGQEIKIGRRGSLTGTLTVRGVQGHTAYPQRADNPLPRLVRYLDALARHVFDEGNEYFAPTNLQITSIDVGNSASNVIPAAGQAVFNMRFNNIWTAQSLTARLHAILDEQGGTYDLRIVSNAESFITAPNDFTALAAAAIEKITGHRPALTTTGGTSDARFVQQYCPVVEFGLVNKTIHKTDEHVAVADITALTAIYKEILITYFGG